MDQQVLKLQVQNLRISFRTAAGKVQAVRGISFDLHKGETLAIVGESGSGKSVTSKAILGIQAPNAITEGGEILYDGMDLLQIDEADFCRLRGDRLAMIFQDPLSSLNPIMRVGKQLTEAMLLKGRMRQRNSRHAFNEQIRLLETYMMDAQAGGKDEIRRNIEIYRKLETAMGEAEKKYRDAHLAAEDALSNLDRMMYLIEKKALSENSLSSKIREYVEHARHPQLLNETDVTTITDALNETGKLLGRPEDAGKALDILPDSKSLLARFLEKPDPDFEQYVREKHADIPPHFLADFEQLAEKGISAAQQRYRASRSKAMDVLRAGLASLRESGIEALKSQTDAVCKAVNEAIDPIDPIKDSQACTFAGSMRKFLAAYEDGIKHNDRKQKMYERETAKAERRKAKGKSWTVPAPSVIDLDLVRRNLDSLISSMIEHWEKRDHDEDAAAKTRAVMASVHENTIGMASEITKWAARDKALKLMEEVGISEPEKRYRQYPFEFSGGMRQRIVIAIALAADPDILICDEPTTALDVTIQAQILELINKLKAERHLSIVFITHDLGVVANMADRIAVMYAGKIVEYGTSEEIFYSPAHPYTWALLSSMPDLDTKEKLEAIPGTPPNMIYPPKGDAFAERNRYAMQIDFEQQPPEFPITDTHWAATWLLHPDAPKVDIPESVQRRIEKMKARMEAEQHG